MYVQSLRPDSLGHSYISGKSQVPVLQLIHNYVILPPVKLQAIQARGLQYKTPVKFTVKIRRIDCGIK